MAIELQSASKTGEALCVDDGLLPLRCIEFATATASLDWLNNELCTAGKKRNAILESITFNGVLPLLLSNAGPVAYITRGMMYHGDCQRLDHSLHPCCYYFITSTIILLFILVLFTILLVII